MMHSGRLPCTLSEFDWKKVEQDLASKGELALDVSQYCGGKLALWRFSDYTKCGLDSSIELRKWGHKHLTHRAIPRSYFIALVALENSRAKTKDVLLCDGATACRTFQEKQEHSGQFVKQIHYFFTNGSRRFTHWQTWDKERMRPEAYYEIGKFVLAHSLDKTRVVRDARMACAVDKQQKYVKRWQYVEFILNNEPHDTQAQSLRADLQFSIANDMTEELIVRIQMCDRLLKNQPQNEQVQQLKTKLEWCQKLLA